MKRLQRQNGERTLDTILAAVGPVVRKAMTGAIKVIRHEEARLTVEKKTGYDGADTDMVTNLDGAAQKCYLRHFRRHLPELGLVCEEGELRKLCNLAGKAPDFMYITVDPLDGTKAAAQLLSQAVGTMIAVVCDGKVVAAYVGDVNTGEIYGFAPDEPTPVRRRRGRTLALPTVTGLPLAKGYALLDAAPEFFPANVQALIRKPELGGLVKGLGIARGSYGIFFTRLWKGEEKFLVLGPAFTTPWDETPVMAITKALGFVTVKVDPATGAFEVYDMPLTTDVHRIDYVHLVVHQDNLEAVLQHLGGGKMG